MERETTNKGQSKMKLNVYKVVRKNGSTVGFQFDRPDDNSLRLHEQGAFVVTAEILKGSLVMDAMGNKWLRVGHKGDTFKINLCSAINHGYARV